MPINKGKGLIDSPLARPKHKNVYYKTEGFIHMWSMCPPSLALFCFLSYGYGTLGDANRLGSFFAFRFFFVCIHAPLVNDIACNGAKSQQNAYEVQQNA